MGNYIPNEDLCKTLASTYKGAATLISKIEEAAVLLKKLISANQAVKFGSTVAGIATSTVISAVGAIAAKVAQNALGAFSKMSARILERFFAALCKMLLISPTAIYSLVSIPHERAVISAREEAIYIEKARMNLTAVLQIILKWVKGFSNVSAYDKIVRALPYVIRAIDAAQRMIKDLEANPGNTGAARNAVFNETIYNTLRSNIDEAIKITTTDSFVLKQAEMERRIEDRRRKIYKAKSDVVTSDISKRTKDLNKWFSEQLALLHAAKQLATYNQDSSLTSQTSDLKKKEDALKALYSSKLSSLKDEKKFKLIRISDEAKREAESLWSDFTSNLKITVDELFGMDVTRLKRELVDLVDNVKHAYTNNKDCQLYCNNLYHMRGGIQALVKEMIAMIRQAGNAGAEAVIASLNSVDVLLAVTRGIFEDSIDKKASGEISQAQLSLNMLMGNTSLVAADALLDATITDSLVKLINSDDILNDADGQFNQFMVRLENIRDWDGQYNVWATKMLQGATTPYIQLISDAFTLLVQVPLLSFNKSDENAGKIRIVTRHVNDVFTKLTNHNHEVANVLASYSPYQDSDIIDIKKILNSLGMLEQFAKAMSILSLVNTIIGTLKGSFFNDGEATVEGCRSAYPELFVDPDVIKYAAISRQNFPAKEFYIESQDDNESKETDILSTRLELNSSQILNRPASDTLGSK